MGRPITFTPGQTAVILLIVVGIPTLILGIAVAGIWGAVDHRLRGDRARASTAAGAGLVAAVLPVAGLFGAYVVARHRAEYPDLHPRGGVVVPTTIPDGMGWDDLGVDAALVSPDGQDVLLHATHLPVADGVHPCNVTTSTAAPFASATEVDVTADAHTHGSPGSMGGCVWGSGTLAVHLTDPLGGRDLVIFKGLNPPPRFRRQPDGAYTRCAPDACDQPEGYPTTTA